MKQKDLIKQALMANMVDYQKLYKQMLLIRRFEERASKLYKMGEIAGFCHLYIGQEAIVVGIKELLTNDDFMITTYRDHGHMLVCDIDPGAVMAELTGRKTGISKGKGGSMHMFSLEKHFMGGHGIVGATSSLGTGMAFAQKYKNENGITVSFMGDGAMNQGQVYESFNLASLWQLPVLYIIEDNGYAIGTSKNRCAAGSELFKRAQPFGIPGKIANGMNLDSVLEAAKWGTEYVRQNCAPAIIQFETYRFKGHSMSDATRLYRAKEEEEEYITNQDCLKILQNTAQITDSQVEQMEKEIQEIVDHAEQVALTSEELEPENLMNDIYSE